MSSSDRKKEPTENDPLLPASAFSTANDDKSNLMNLESLEEKRKRRVVVILTVTTAFLVIVGALLIWRLVLYQNEKRYQRPYRTTEFALAQLNKHSHKQTKHIAATCESTLVLMRHCEKNGLVQDENVVHAISEEPGTEHCSYVGLERAHYVASLFGRTTGARWPVPAHLFALTPDRVDHLNFREWETLQPLSKSIGIITEIATLEGFPKLYFELLQSGDLCGRVVVVSWKHESIPDLANALGCGPDQGCPLVYDENDYDSVWEIKYVFRPKLIIDQHKEEKIKKAENSTANNAREANKTATTDNNNENIDDDDEYEVATDAEDAKLVRKESSPENGWNVFGTVVHEQFDPLQFSKSHGDYPSAGTARGGRWQQHPTIKTAKKKNEH